MILASTVIDKIFGSISSDGEVTIQSFFLIFGVSLVCSLIFSIIIAIKMKASKRFFISSIVIPVVTACLISFITNAKIVVGVAIGGAFALIRFRSAQGNAEEIATIFIEMVAGVVFGFGYLAYGAIFMIAMALLMLLLQIINIWNHPGQSAERLVKITVPEDLDFVEAFEEEFKEFTKYHELIKAKTTNMGSMYRLTYKVIMKDRREEKKLVDKIRMKNGNLEVMICDSILDNNL